MADESDGGKTGWRIAALVIMPACAVIGWVVSMVLDHRARIYQIETRMIERQEVVGPALQMINRTSHDLEALEQRVGRLEQR